MRRLLLLLLLGVPLLWTHPTKAAPPAWTELSSTHFRVLSEAPAAVARDTLQMLEALRPAVLEGVGAPLEPGGVDVILFANRERYQELAGKGSVAKTSWRTTRPLILLRAAKDGGAPRRSVLAHELTHALSHAVLGPQPRWLAEGLAERLEDMVPVDGARGMRIPGPAASPRWTALEARTLLPLSRLWAWERTLPPRRELPTYYAASWAWTSYLATVHPARWRDFLAGLGRGTVAREAFDRAFDGVSEARLWDGLQGWLGQGRATPERVVSLTPSAGAIVEVPLAASEARVLRAWLRLLGFDGRGREERRRLAARELDVALTLQPGLPSALRLQGLLGARWDAEHTSLAELR